MHESINGVVVRVRDTGDHDRYLSVLTAERGRITILSKGSKSMRGPQMSVSQLYTYGNFEYYRRGSYNILKGGSVLDHFFSLCSDLDSINLASYFCEVMCEVTDEGEDASGMLRLMLNSLYAISRKLYSRTLIKGAFEMRVAADAGYAPDLETCAVCSKASAERWYLDVMNGALLCADCLSKRGREVRHTGTYDDIREAQIICPVSAAVREALRYTVHAPMERLFSFTLTDDEDLRAFDKATETYLLSHLGRGFDSLEFYNMMRSDLKTAKGT